MMPPFTLDWPDRLNIDDVISLKHLRVLHILIQERSLTRAAEILDTSQPALSKILARLRTHFADPLFVRVGVAMQPTTKALEIAGPLRALLATSDQMRASPAPFEPTTSDREFRLLVTDVGMMRFLPPLISRLSEAGARLRLVAIPLDSRQFEPKLETGEADIAIGDFPQAAVKLRRQKLYSDVYLSVVRKNHPRLAELTSAAIFLAERHIVVTASNTGHAAHESLERALEVELPLGNIQLRLPSFIAAAFVVQRTDAIVTMPANLAKLVADELGLIAVRPPLQLPEFEIAQFWHERAQSDPGHQWLRALIFSTFHQGSARMGQ